MKRKFTVFRSFFRNAFIPFEFICPRLPKWEFKKSCGSVLYKKGGLWGEGREKAQEMKLMLCRLLEPSLEPRNFLWKLGKFDKLLKIDSRGRRVESVTPISTWLSSKLCQRKKLALFREAEEKEESTEDCLQNNTQYLFSKSCFSGDFS